MAAPFTVAGQDDSDDEMLVLQRLNTGPRPSSLHREAPSKDEEYYGPRGHEQSHDDDEEAFLGVPNELQQPVLDKTGRPEWLEDGLTLAKSSRRARLFLALSVLLLVAGVFSFAFSGSTDNDSRLGRIYKLAGDVWHAGGASGVTDYGDPYLFPTDIGYPGPTQTGKNANLANEDASVAEPTRGSSPIVTNVPELKGFDLFKHLGPLTPYSSAPDFGISSAKYRSLPDHCRVERVHILHRHGSRYPTGGSPANDVRNLVKDVRKANGKFKGPLSFLNHYDADRLGLELLVPVGREQLFESGVQHGMEYGLLAEHDAREHGRIMVRTGSQQRIVDSAIAFLQGMFGAKWHSHTDLEVQVEAPGFNTTLAPNFACPNAGRPEMEPGIQWAKEWADDYLSPAIGRLQPFAPSSVKLSGRLLNGMQQLCSYDTVAFGRSDFCRLFTEKEWHDYEYFWDLQFYGGYGDGTPIGKAQGIGWVNEFISRLTRQPWDASLQTSENATLNNDPRTFPIDRRFYADFTHDSTIAGVIAALNLPQFAKALPTHHPDPNRAYHTSTIVPFAARLVFEQIDCERNDKTESLVRLLLNEAIIDLHQLRGCPSRPDGMCPYNDFIAATSSRNEWADWQNCTRQL